MFAGTPSLKPRLSQERVYAFLMTASLEEVRCHGVWNALAALHYLAQVCVDSEALAETVGSIMASVETKSAQQLSSRHLAWATKLKSCGLTGFGGADNFMSRALNEHFSCQGPGGLDFDRKSRKRKHGGGDCDLLLRRERIRRSVRQEHLPEWFHQAPTALYKHRKLCKLVPEPMQFLVGKDRSRLLRNAAATKRREVAEEAQADAFRSDTLHSSVWSRLNVTVQSLPSSLRPGRYPR